MLRWIIWAFIFYWLIRFIFNFLVPVFRATRQMKQQTRDFRNRMDGQGNFQHSGSAFNTNRQNGAEKTGAAPHRPDKSRSGDYIDFEEVD